MRRSGSGLVKWLLLAAIGGAGPWMAGCGDGRPARAPISGQVLIDGAPLTRGTVCIIPKDARMAAGVLGPDGRFTMRCFEEDDGAVLGTHPVTVTSFENVNESTRKWFAPKKYSDPRKSGVTVTVDEENDSLVIELTWDGGKPFVERFVNGRWQ